jgi:trans-2,3-dihydro-3-hydroxyanthranilate isomerase
VRASRSISSLRAKSRSPKARAIVNYRYYLVDVFSRSPFGGNQLAVLPEARRLSPEGMQKIAQEFNLAETAFVLSKDDARNTFKVRIFTPRSEIPFAGHPTIGTACALAMGGYTGDGDTHNLILEEGVGPVGVAVEKREGVWNGLLTLACKLEQPTETPSTVELAEVLSLTSSDVRRVFCASVGIPFCFVQLTSPQTVDRAAIDSGAWRARLANTWAPHVFFFSGDIADGGELYARMCAPALGVAEDPATGSASAALVGTLAANSQFQGSVFALSIKQGVAMGRPSYIRALAKKMSGVLTSVSVGGATSYVAEGEIEVPAAFLTESL